MTEPPNWPGRILVHVPCHIASGRRRNFVQPVTGHTPGRTIRNGTVVKPLSGPPRQQPPQHDVQRPPNKRLHIASTRRQTTLMCRTGSSSRAAAAGEARDTIRLGPLGKFFFFCFFTFSILATCIM
jgi:hypothetical protein